MIAIDFETHPITDLCPHPKPVGVSITRDGKSKYYAWGHPTRNNCTKLDGKKAVHAALTSGQPLVFFNALFDLGVMRHLGLRPMGSAWDRIHDAQILAFLADPRAMDLTLKGTAHRVLNLKPDERDKLREWILAYVPGARRKKSKWGAFIAQAPGDLVGRYAIGDTQRTLRLFRHWRKLAQSAAYERERSLIQICDHMQYGGVPIDRKRLSQSQQIWEGWLAACERWLRKSLKSPGLDLGKTVDVAARCEDAGWVTEWIATKTGAISFSVESLRTLVSEGNFTNAKFVEVWAYYSYLKYLLQTFVRPWLAHTESDGHLHATWAATRREGAGARTGRFSTSPNIQNITKRTPSYQLPAELKKLWVRSRTCASTSSLRLGFSWWGQTFLSRSYGSLLTSSALLCATGICPTRPSIFTPRFET